MKIHYKLLRAFHLIDEFLFIPDTFSGSTAEFKARCVYLLSQRQEAIVDIHVWDDDERNIESIRRLDFPGTIVVNQVDVALRPTLDSIDFMPWSPRQTDAYSKAGKLALNLIQRAWASILRINVEDAHHLLCTFGSHVFGKRGDIDLCIIGPNKINQERFQQENNLPLFRLNDL